jgi:hypothetical protein
MGVIGVLLEPTCSPRRKRLTHVGYSAAESVGEVESRSREETKEHVECCKNCTEGQLREYKAATCPLLLQWARVVSRLGT